MMRKFQNTSSHCKWELTYENLNEWENCDTYQLQTLTSSRGSKGKIGTTRPEKRLFSVKTMEYSNVMGEFVMLFRPTLLISIRDYILRRQRKEQRRLKTNYFNVNFFISIEEFQWKFKIHNNEFNSPLNIFMGMKILQWNDQDFT